MSTKLERCRVDARFVSHFVFQSRIIVPHHSQRLAVFALDALPLSMNGENELCQTQTKAQKNYSHHTLRGRYSRPVFTNSCPCEFEIKDFYHHKVHGQDHPAQSNSQMGMELEDCGAHRPTLGVSSISLGVQESALEHDNYLVKDPCYDISRLWTIVHWWYRLEETSHRNRNVPIQRTNTVKNKTDRIRIFSFYEALAWDWNIIIITIIMIITKKIEENKINDGIQHPYRHLPDKTMVIETTWMPFEIQPTHYSSWSIRVYRNTHKGCHSWNHHKIPISSSGGWVERKRTNHSGWYTGCKYSIYKSRSCLFKQRSELVQFQCSISVQIKGLNEFFNLLSGKLWQLHTEDGW